jgi:hypothetical protein
MAMRGGGRELAGAAMLALVLTVGFSRESFGLWPLFTVLDFSGQLGRAAAFILGQGQAPSLVLGPVPDLRLASAPFVEILAGALGLALTLAAGAFCLFAASRQWVRQPALLIVSGLLLLGALWPPYGYLRTPAPLIAGIVLGALALPALTTRSERSLQFLGFAFLLAPLWEMREPLIVSGAPGTDLALLERGSGIPASVWAVVGLALAAGAFLAVLGASSNAGSNATAISSTPLPGEGNPTTTPPSTR